MTMQRRHFEVITEALAASKPSPHDSDASARYSQWRAVVSQFCGRLSVTNGQFNKAPFLTACGVDE